MADETPDSLISLKTVAGRLSVDKRTVYRMIARGDLPRPIKVGRSSRLYSSEIDKYLQRITTNRS